MKLSERWTPDIYQGWLCPDLRRYWTLGLAGNSDCVILKSVEGDRRFQFSGAEGYALRHFTGQFSLQQIQAICQKKFGESFSSLFVLELLQKLVDLKILELQEEAVVQWEGQANATETAARSKKTAAESSNFNLKHSTLKETTAFQPNCQGQYRLNRVCRACQYIQLPIARSRPLPPQVVAPV